MGRECTNIVKTNEGASSKVFLLSFDNGTEAIAKLPTPMAGPAHLTTSSEVATMDYARTVLNLPVPHVYAWNSRAESTPVGAEYIIMEKAPGEPLHTTWCARDSILPGSTAPDFRNFGPVLTAVTNMEKQFGARAFSQIGNIYYVEDVAPHLRDRPLYAPGHADTAGGCDRFRIGPLVDWGLWRGGRILQEEEAGPYADLRPLAHRLARG
ncbi:hypothetical protein DXG03_005266 [Asterophora parasitica]|uniref:Altered inheritance of mitochondria protein 9, mitochondrial n=1 Tax=Asterophora parasitica TaxID=117018 RepID=A0A9P7G5X8_9AGAR|nr:hypothetical protein DXG03_005266 [Asterophora parasitica]